MADNSRKIPINNNNDDDDDFDEDGSRTVSNANFDTSSDRPTINLDEAGDIHEAIAAAARVAKPAENEDVLDFDLQQGEFVSSTSSVELSNLKQQLADAQVQAQTANENQLRSLADIQNMRRRTEEERIRIIRDGNERLIKELLPVLDDFDLALNAAKQSESYEQLVSGMEAIYRKFVDTLGKQGVVPIEAVGTTFNPDVHEAVMVDEDSNEADETVTAELRRGYLLNGRVIRPSLVKVSKA